MALGLLLGLQLGTVNAQNNVPIENPTESEIIEALGGNSNSKPKCGLLTPSPDAARHACPEVMVSGASTSGLDTKNRAPVSFARDRACGINPAINLAIKFATNSDKVLPASQSALNTLARALMSPNLLESTFAVAGHTDAQGSLWLNLELSCARAIAVRSYLIQRGVDPARLGAYGFGPNRPIQQGVEVSAINRRIEIRRAN